MSSHKSQLFIYKLENLIKEAVTLALYEQQPAPAPPPPVAPDPSQGSPVPPPAPAPPPDQAAAPAPPEQAQQPMTIDSMIERLNVIRGGKSFTDPEIYGQLVTYFKKMTPEQNQIIDQYLQDVSRIMVNVRTGTEPAAEDMGQPAAPPPANVGGGTQAPISPSGGGVSPAGGGGSPSPAGV